MSRVSSSQYPATIIVTIMRQIVRFNLAILLLFTVKSAAAYTSQDCIDCHKIGSSESALQISIVEFNASIHGEEAACRDCHTSVENQDHVTAPGSRGVECSSCMNRKIVTAGDRTAARVLNVIPAIPDMACGPRTIRFPPFIRNDWRRPAKAAIPGNAVRRIIYHGCRRCKLLLTTSRISARCLTEPTVWDATRARRRTVCKNPSPIKPVLPAI